MRSAAVAVAAGLAMIMLSACGDEDEPAEPEAAANGIADEYTTTALRRSIEAMRSYDDLTFKGTVTAGGDDSVVADVEVRVQTSGACEMTYAGDDGAEATIRSVDENAYWQTNGEGALMMATMFADTEDGLSAEEAEEFTRTVGEDWVRVPIPRGALSFYTGCELGFFLPPRDDWEKFDGEQETGVRGEPARKVTARVWGQPAALFLATTGDLRVLRTIGTDGFNRYDLRLIATDSGFEIKRPADEDVLDEDVLSGRGAEAAPAGPSGLRHANDL